MGKRLSAVSGLYEWIQGIFTSARKHPFVFVAMLTAFPYTAWCAANVLHGVAPTDDGARMLYWLTAILFATTIDIGAVSASARLSERWGVVDFLAFLVMVGGMWYVQTLYALIHYAPLELSPSIPAHMRETAQTLRDLAVWLLPVFIPVPLVINALRGIRITMPGHVFVRRERVSTAEVRITKIEPPQPHTPLPPSTTATLPTEARTPNTNTSGGHTGEATGHIDPVDGGFRFTCPKCGKQDTKPTRDGAQSALNVHLGRWCPARKSADAIAQPVEQQG